jgi:hypothetical protein
LPIVLVEVNGLLSFGTFQRRGFQRVSSQHGTGWFFQFLDHHVGHQEPDREVEQLGQ